MKYYNLNEIRKKFFPNFAECVRCGGFNPKSKMYTCPHCLKLVCNGCYWEHTLWCPK